MKRVTHSGLHIDRAACAWLIRTRVDADAKFEFVDDPSSVPDDATPFDMRGVVLSHPPPRRPAASERAQVRAAHLGRSACLLSTG